MGTPPMDGAPHPADESQSSALARYTPQSTAPSKTNETGAVMLAARARAEIESSMIVAIQRPRDVDHFREVILKACDRPIFADQAMYEKPTGRKNGKETFATGLSIRFAEEAARHYGNLDISVTVIAEDDESRTIEAKGVDLETNVWYRAQAKFAKYVERLNPRQGEEVVGSRVNSRGVTTYKIRASDDQIFMEHQRAAAKATREVTLKLIPSWVKEECEERIERTLDQVGKDPEKFRSQVASAFDRKGVSLAALEKYLGKSLSSADVSELKLLKRIYNSISQGETTWAEIVGQKEADAAESVAASDKGVDGLKSKLGGKAKPAAEPAAQAAEPAKDAAAAVPEKPKSDKCPVCFMTGGKHDPNAPCYAD